MKRLSHAVVSDFVKIRKRGFGNDGAEVRAGFERLQELRGAHGFSEPEDAARMVLRRQEVEPLPNVVALEQTVGSERPAAGTLRASVGEENAVAVSGQQPRVAGHADAVIAEAVKENDRISVSVPRTDGPGAECDRIGRGDENVLQIGVDCMSGVDHGGFIFGRERTTRRVQCAVGDPDSSDGAEREIEDDGENQASGSAGERHSGLEDDTRASRVRFREMSKAGWPIFAAFFAAKAGFHGPVPLGI